MIFAKWETLPGIFIVGTGTDVGKTYVSASVLKRLRAQGLRATYYKAACSGAFVEGRPCDAAAVQKIAGIPPEDAVVSYAYEEAVSPHLAARHTGRFPDLAVIQRDFETLKARSDFVVAEGSGGILCPLLLEPEREELWLEDVIRVVDLPVAVVVDAGLGTLNATLLTLHYLKARMIPTLGVFLNRFDPQNPVHCDNKVTLERHTDILLCLEKEGVQTEGAL